MLCDEFLRDWSAGCLIRSSVPRQPYSHNSAFIALVHSHSFTGEELGHLPNTVMLSCFPQMVSLIQFAVAMPFGAVLLACSAPGGLFNRRKPALSLEVYPFHSQYEGFTIA